MKTQKEVRQAFWNEYSEFYGHEYKTKKRQNEYSVDCRCSFVDFVNWLQREGTIGEKLANRVIL
jgi:hypothetical protein